MMKQRKKKVNDLTQPSPTIANDEDRNDLNSVKNAAEMKTKLLDMWNKISKSDRGKIFKDAVTESIAPGYFDVVSDPMDLTLIKEKIDNGLYSNQYEFEYDMKLTFTNAMKYNGPETIYYKKAKNLLGIAANLFCGVNSPDLIETSTQDAKKDNSQTQDILMAGEQIMNPDVDNEAIEAYEEIVKWRKNIFMIPTGKIGKQFVQRMKDHIDSWCNEDKSGQMALKYVMIMPQILLQNPVRNPSACQIKETLERRLAM